jgi:hypothetical protein
VPPFRPEMGALFVGSGANVAPISADLESRLLVEHRMEKTFGRPVTTPVHSNVRPVIGSPEGHRVFPVSHRDLLPGPGGARPVALVGARRGRGHRHPVGE